MALTHHDDIELAAGDDWAIPGTLLDENGQPLDLTNATLAWTLLGPDGCPALTAGQYTISVVPQQTGNIKISVNRIVTGLLPPGRYTDAMYATIGGTTTTMWVGNILVSVNLAAIICAPNLLDGSTLVPTGMSITVTESP